MSELILIKPSEAELAVENIRKRLHGNRPTITEILRYRTPDEWFQHQTTGIHGKLHIARTTVYGILLARLVKTDEPKIDEEVILSALSGHDIFRRDILEDPGHGQRAAEFMGSQLKDIEPTKLQHIISIVHWHDAPRETIPHSVRTIEHDIAMDADALDRVRDRDLDIPEEAQLDPNSLHFKISRTILFPIAQELYRRTKHMPESFESVGIQAIQMGILRSE